MNFRVIFLSNLIFLNISCGNSENHKDNSIKSLNQSFPFSSPDKTIFLPVELEEISDISIMANGNIGGIEDESGVIFEINPDNGDIISKSKFAGSRDFEGLTFAGSNAYAGTSDGVIFEIKNYGSKQNVKEYSTKLSKENNVEGLCFDDANSSILLICKDHPGSALNHKEFKAIYRFDTKTNKLDDEPFIKIPLAKIEKMQGQTDGKKEGKVNFHPSGIAIHPITGNYFVIASAGKLIVELNKSHDIVNVNSLPKDIFTQPEGIAFDKEGGLYISNEGKGERASIVYFKKI